MLQRGVSSALPAALRMHLSLASMRHALLPRWATPRCIGAVADGATAREIADTKGWGSGKPGERKAVAAQDNALEALAVLAKI